jgi:hypothetical protein
MHKYTCEFNTGEGWEKKPWIISNKKDSRKITDR